MEGAGFRISDFMALEIYASQPVLKRLVKTALHQAVLDGRLHQVRLLVTKHGVDVDCKDLYGRTPLMLACLLDNEEYGYKMVKILLKAGAKLVCKDHANMSFLAYACMKGREIIVRRILKEDIVEINDRDQDGNTPLMHAALSGNPGVVRLITDALVRFGIAVDVRNKFGYTALLLACKHGHYVSAHILLVEASACPSLRDNEFFMNAAEWTENSALCETSRTDTVINNNDRNPCRAFSSVNRSSLSFERESTFYGKQLTPVCQHVRPREDPMKRSLDSLRLPAIPSKNPVCIVDDATREININGASAREVLLDAIDDVIHSISGEHGHVRPMSRGSTMFTKASFLRATPKLLANSSRSKSMMVPDMNTIFDIYSDQFCVRSVKSRPPSHVDGVRKLKKRVSILEPKMNTGEVEV